jgi:hypothetical protein
MNTSSAGAGIDEGESILNLCLTHLPYSSPLGSSRVAAYAATKDRSTAGKTQRQVLWLKAAEWWAGDMHGLWPSFGAAPGERPKLSSGQCAERRARRRRAGYAGSRARSRAPSSTIR